MLRILAFFIACVVGLTTGAEASRKRHYAPRLHRPLPTQPAQVEDEYKWCDVHVRDFVQGRKDATALPVKEIKVDGLRMRLNFVHAYGESGDTPPNLAFTRGDTIEERRRALNETKQRIGTLVEAAKAGNIWYVIALKKDNLAASDLRRGASSVQGDETRSPIAAVVLASLDNKCVTISEFQNMSPDMVSADLRRLLGEKDREGLAADVSVTGSTGSNPSAGTRVGESGR